MPKIIFTELIDLDLEPDKVRNALVAYYAHVTPLITNIETGQAFCVKLYYRGQCVMLTISLLNLQVLDDIKISKYTVSNLGIKTEGEPVSLNIADTSYTASGVGRVWYPTLRDAVANLAIEYLAPKKHALKDHDQKDHDRFIIFVFFLSEAARNELAQTAALAGMVAEDDGSVSHLLNWGDHRDVMKNWNTMLRSVKNDKSRYLTIKDMWEYVNLSPTDGTKRNVGAILNRMGFPCQQA